MQKTNFKTRLLALLTAVFMVIVSIPFAAFADAEGLKEIKVAFYQYTDNGSVQAAGDFSLKPGEDNFIPSCFLPESGLDDSKLDHWTYQNGKADFKPGASVTYNELLIWLLLLTKMAWVILPWSLSSKPRNLLRRPSKST